MKIHQTIDAFCKAYRLIPTGSRIVLGLSGGPDSIFLLHYLAQLHRDKIIHLIAAHLDHQWRQESYKDVEFCLEATQALGIELVSAKASELGLTFKFKGSKEELGRSMRRHFLQQIHKQKGADFIALAHQAQDQEETFFIRLLRGSSLTGLTSMRPKQGIYIRPLLSISRQEIIEYLDANKIVYLTDPSNESDVFLRNRIRKSVLPALRQVDSRFDNNFARTLEQLQQTEDFLLEYTINTLEEISTRQESHLSISTKKFNILPPILKKRVLIAWLCAEKVPFVPTESFFNEIIKFLSREPAKTHQLHQHWSIDKRKHSALIKKI